MIKSGKVLMDPGQVREFDGAVMRALPKDMTAERAQKWIKSPKELQKALRQALILEASSDINCLLEKKEQWYKSVFGRDADLYGLEVPDHQPGFDRLLVIAQGLTLNGAYDKCAERFPCWRYKDDLDKAVTVNDRVPDKTYAIWCRDRVEADEELKSFSADTLKEKGTKCLTLLERIVLELEYYTETGKHLDVSNVILCAGSRCCDGRVPYAYWRGGAFDVGWSYPGDADGRLRARAAVS